MSAPQAKPSQPQKKKHHFIPQTYLEQFTDERGKLLFYRKDDPENPLPMTPDNVGHRRYYYSQPIPGGGQDNNGLEDLFSETETHWGPIVRKIRNDESINADLENLLQFVSLLRVRVPAIRDAAEFMFADLAKETLHELDRLGKLPTMPEGVGDLLENVEITIDPHQSIHAMPHMMYGFAQLLDMIGFKILRNKTGLSLLTNDNPVIVLDPDVHEKSLQPYKVRPPSRRVEIIMAIDPWHMLHGHTDYKYAYSRQGIIYEDSHSVSFVKRANRLVTRYGYEAIYASNNEHAPLIEKYASLSPIPEFKVMPYEGGEAMIHGWKFGQRLVKPKWESREEEQVT